MQHDSNIVLAIFTTNPHLMLWALTIADEHLIAYVHGRLINVQMGELAVWAINWRGLYTATSVTVMHTVRVIAT